MEPNSQVRGGGAGGGRTRECATFGVMKPTSYRTAQLRVAREWVKAVCRALGGGSGFAHVIWFVNRSEYKTPSCELQDLRRGKRYPASRTGWVLVKKMRCGPGRPDPL
jgi:hypothetical protein